MRWFIWLSQLLYLLLLLHFQFTSSFSLSSPFSSSSALLCSQEQSIALLQFKGLFSFSDSDYCDQHSYPKMETWKEGTDCCSWDGVTCDRVRGDVIGLDLSCSWLKGTIPSNSSLFLLHHLQRLNLAFNNFESSNISSGFGQFSRLRYLNLSSSYFCGQVPIELSHLSQLVSLDLTTSFWQGPFRRSGQGTFKRSAYDRAAESETPLVMLQTSVVKSLLQNLTKLGELHLDHSDLSSVSPSSFMNLSSSLTSLALKDCQLNGKLPDSIFCLPNLRELSLNVNFELIGSFPMVNWTNPLRFLDVSYTLFSGELPKSIGNLKFLKYLGLSRCNFSKSLPATLGNLTQLTFFDLSYNNFGGEIPSSLSNLKALDHFDLHSNNLSGKISSLLLVGNAK
jgi:Leucine-rich repeat (LRR) protein